MGVLSKEMTDFVARQACMACYHFFPWFRFFQAQWFQTRTVKHVWYQGWLPEMTIECHWLRLLFGKFLWHKVTASSLWGSSSPREERKTGKLDVGVVVITTSWICKSSFVQTSSDSLPRSWYSICWWTWIINLHVVITIKNLIKWYHASTVSLPISRGKGRWEAAPLLMLLQVELLVWKGCIYSQHNTNNYITTYIYIYIYIYICAFINMYT